MATKASIQEARKIVGSLLNVRKLNTYDIQVTGSNLQFERIRGQVVTMFENAGYTVRTEYSMDRGVYRLDCTKGA